MTEAGQTRVETSPKRVRVMLGGEFVADSRRSLLVWEKPYYPTYYFPEEDVRMDRLYPAAEIRRTPGLGEATVYNVKGGAVEAAAAGAYTHPDSPVARVRGHYAFRWGAMDHWFEEDQEVFVHARDPYKRIDILPGSRHVRIEVDGVTLADSRRPTLLFETSLPVRYYLPKTEVRLDLLVASDKLSECPYKGTAEYWSFMSGQSTHPDIAWSYPFPTSESLGVAGLVSFYDERVDVFLDGERQDSPPSPFT